MEEGTRRAVVAAFLANLGIAVAKLLSFAVTGSPSMLAESFHSAADTGNQALLFLGSRKARRRPTPRHPFGFGQERYFWAFVVALVLFSLGSLFAINEGISKLRHPSEMESHLWAYGVLGIAVVLESLSLRTAYREARHEKMANEGWWTFIRRSTTPEVPVVMLEDTGALLGLMLALAGVTTAQITGNPRFDALGSLGIGVLLGVIAVFLAVEMKSLLIGESASPAVISRIQSALSTAPMVRRIIHLRTLHLGPDELLVAAKLEFDATISFRELAEAIDGAERRVRATVPTARVIYIEPDRYHGPTAMTVSGSGHI